MVPAAVKVLFQAGKEQAFFADPTPGIDAAQACVERLQTAGDDLRSMRQGALQPLAQIVHVNGVIGQKAARVFETGLQGVESCPSGRKPAALGRDQPFRKKIDAGAQFGPFGNDQLRRRGRRGRAQVRDKIADGKVRFMADRRNNGNRAARNSARQRFIVERRQVLQRTAAPRDNDHIDSAGRLESRQRRDDFARRLGALHAGRRNQNVHRREAPSRNV